MSKQDIIGYVEHLEPSAIEGWAISLDGKAVQLVLRIAGSEYPLDAVWVERADVAQQQGAHFLVSGFRASLSNATNLAIKNALLHGDAIAVIADGAVLQNVADLPAPANLLHTEPLMVSKELDGQRCVVESWGYFTIFGWALVGDCAAENFSLKCNGAVLSCNRLTYERPDVAQALGVSELSPGFGIELPGYMWDVVAESDDANIQLEVGERDFITEPLVLTRAMAGRWVIDICRMYEGQEKQYRLFHALEHVRYGGLSQYLDDAAKACLRDFALRMNLRDFIELEAEHRPASIQAPSMSATQLLLERALRSLNAKILSLVDPLLVNVKRVIEEHQLIGEPHERFCMAVVPLLCQSGALNGLRELMNFDLLKQLGEEEGLWEMSLAPPACVLDGEIKRAAKIFWRISKRLTHGWLNTECVRFAVREALRLEAAGVVNPDVAEELRNSFVGLVDGFGGEWFSRLHDRELIETMIDILGGAENYRDSHRREMVLAGIRFYGLSSTFWEILVERDIPLTDELLDAQVAWNELSGQLSDPRRLFAERLDKIAEALGFFVRYQAQESVNVSREVIANVLTGQSLDFESGGRSIIETLLSHHEAEAVRLAAAPLAKINAHMKGFSATFANMRETLRLCSEYETSPAFSLQEGAAKLLKLAARDRSAGDDESLRFLLGKIRAKGHLLSTKSTCYLGADVLAHAYRMAHDACLAEQNYLLMELGQAIGRAVSETPWNGFLAQPVQTALSHLSSLPADTLLKAFLQEIQALLRNKFGGRYDYIFSWNAAKDGACKDDLCWPSDILVVIYSCRKYLGSRVKAIRETWLKDLQDRGIPYLVAVGDGDDCVRGDVLELAVSDRYEDLPQKTLKLLEWVFQQSGAQFLLKIDDDCYLDVDRYFDSLSYRKHPYYGQIVSGEEGRMDRLWHMSKSQDPYAKKSLDKSPEPSIYAKGGGGYCLSRAAMGKALETANTAAGIRLLSCSYMEDKYVGDLLSLAGIRPSNEDYEFYYRFRGSAQGLPVGMWENGFFPSMLSPTKVAHLDREQDQRWVAAHVAREELWPKKIWSTYGKPSITFKGNQMELLTDLKKLAHLLRKGLVVVSVVRNERTMLPHFLAHYRKLGVGCFIFADNCSTDGTLEYLVDQEDVVLYSSDTPYKYSHYGVSWQQAIIGNHCLGKWVVLADADEFLVYEDSENIALLSFLESIEKEGANGVLIHMIDMYPFGDLSEARFDEGNPFDVAPYFDRDAQNELVYGRGHFSNSRNFVNGLRHRLAPSRINAYVSQKYALFKYQPWLRFSEGIHYAANMKVSSRQAYFAHFKYHSEFKDKVVEEVKRKQHFNDAEEYQRYLVMLGEGFGKFGSAERSMKYENSHSFVEAFAHLQGGVRPSSESKHGKDVAK